VASNESQVTIESGGKRLYGMLHRPQGGTARMGVLFCHPFAEEKKSSQRAMVDLARRLAIEGYGSLRFDLTGCGDSEGDFGQATIGTWLGDIRAAMSFLKTAVPTSAYSVAGLRLGATLAVAANVPGVKGLALIEPIISGKESFAADLRRLLIRQMMTDGVSSSNREALVRRLEQGEGDLDYDGFTISGKMYSELAALDLRTGARPHGRVLLLQISPRGTVAPALEGLASLYRDGGTIVEIQTLTMPAMWNLIDEIDTTPLTEVVVGWLKGTTT
jgi:uncharacterized protein